MMKTISKVSQGVKITVQTQYEDDYSNPANKHYLFSYSINIHNLNPFDIQLLHRHWIIKDSLAPTREVSGAGVIGKQPVLQPDEEYQYESSCNLQSDIGLMYGEYIFKNVSNNEHFKVLIPEFTLVIPYKLN